MSDPLHLAFVLCRSPLSLSARELTAAWEQLGDPSLQFGTEVSKAGLAVTLGPHHAVMVAAASKVPGSEAEQFESQSVSRFWDYEPPAVHATHLVVAFSPGVREPSVEVLECFCALLAATAKSVDATGVYWGGAGATHPAEFFLEVMDADTPRCTLWSGVSYAKARHRPGAVSFLSRGLHQLGLMEIEVCVSEGESEEGLQLLLDAVNYVAARGEDIAEGDTFGREPGERMVAGHVQSPVDVARRVCRLDVG